MYLYVSAGICSYLSVCYRHRYFAVSSMYVCVGISMYLYVCVHNLRSPPPTGVVCEWTALGS